MREIETAVADALNGTSQLLNTMPCPINCGRRLVAMPNERLLNSFLDARVAHRVHESVAK